MDQLDGVVKEEEQKDVETEKERRLRLWKEKQPKPVKHADAALVTMTFLVEPPEPYKWTRPRGWKDEVGDVRQKAQETASDIKWTAMPVVPYVVDKINDLNALVGMDAIEIAEERYDVPKEVLERKAKERQPWEVLDRPEQSNPLLLIINTKRSRSCYTSI